VHPAGGQDTREGACRETCFLEHMKRHPMQHYMSPHKNSKLQ
jgi:hypothetical protein